MKFLNYKKQRSTIRMIVGFWLKCILLTSPNLATADISSVTLLSLCSKLQINLDLLPPDLHVHVVYHSPPILDDIAGYLENLEQLTSSPDYKRDVAQGEIMYREHRGKSGLLRDLAKSADPYNLLLKPTKQEAIDLFCHATKETRSCSISNVAEIEIACATAFIDVQVDRCLPKKIQNRHELMECTVNDVMGIFLGDSSHHKNTKILMQALNAYFVKKINQFNWGAK